MYSVCCALCTGRIRTSISVVYTANGIDRVSMFVHGQVPQQRVRAANKRKQASKMTYLATNDSYPRTHLPGPTFHWSATTANLLSCTDSRSTTRHSLILTLSSWRAYTRVHHDDDSIGRLGYCLFCCTRLVGWRGTRDGREEGDERKVCLNIEFNNGDLRQYSSIQLRKWV